MRYTQLVHRTHAWAGTEKKQVEKNSLHDLIDSYSSESFVYGTGGKSAEPGSLPSVCDSIFAQILEKLLSGQGNKFDDDAAGQGGLEILLENSKEAILLLSIDGNVVEANPTFCESYGWSREALKGRRLATLIPEELAPAIEERLVRLGDPTATGATAPESLSFQARTSRGDSVAVECLLAPIRLGDQRAVISAFYADSVDRGLIRQLRQSNDHYLALSETISEAIFRLDSDFNIIFANSGVRNTFGFEREELDHEEILHALPGGGVLPPLRGVPQVFHRR